jgi:hypothetical protein
LVSGAYSEVTGVYEFFIAEQGVMNYIVRAAMGVTVASAVLPYFLERAIRQMRLGRAAMVAVGFMLSVTVVFTAAVHRTVSVKDNAEASRKEASRKLDSAKANVASAETALASDQQLTAGECKTGVGRECKKLAAAGKDTLQTTIDLRTKLADTKEPVEDSTPGTISALTGGRVSVEQVRTFQPMLVPAAVSFLAGLLITIGIAEMEQALAAPGQHQRVDQWVQRLWQRARRRMPPGAGTPPPHPRRRRRPKWPPRRSRRPMVRLQSGAPSRPCPRTLPWMVGRFMIACLARAPKRERVDGEAIYPRYRRYCEEQGFEALGTKTFAVQFVMRCKRQGIDIRRDGTKIYCVGVRLAA